MASPAPTTRTRILDGAGRVFLEKGIQSATVQDILDAAGVSRRTFYQYFSSKDGVIYALYDDLTDQLIAAMGTAVREVSGPERIRRGMDAFLDFEKEGGNLLIVLQAEAVRMDSPLWEIRSKTLQAIVELIDDAVAEVMDFRLDPLVYRVLLMGVGSLVIEMQREHGALGEAERARIREIFVPMLFRFLSSSQGLPTRR